MTKSPQFIRTGATGEQVPRMKARLKKSRFIFCIKKTELKHSVFLSSSGAALAG
jgi:hypothetical protein